MSFGPMIAAAALAGVSLAAGCALAWIAHRGGTGSGGAHAGLARGAGALLVAGCALTGCILPYPG